MFFSYKRFVTKIKAEVVHVKNLNYCLDTLRRLLEATDALQATSDRVYDKNTGHSKPVLGGYMYVNLIGMDSRDTHGTRRCFPSTSLVIQNGLCHYDIQG